MRPARAGGVPADIMGMKRERISKQRIIEAFVSESFTRGAEGTSLSDIAAALGIKKSSLYNHYPNREAIVSDALSYCGGLLCARIPLWLEEARAHSGDFLFAFARALFVDFGSGQLVEAVSLVESEKFFDDVAFSVSSRFKVGMVGALFPVLGARAEGFVGALCLMLDDYVSAGKMMARRGCGIEISEEKLRALINGFSR